MTKTASQRQQERRARCRAVGLEEINVAMPSQMVEEIRARAAKEGKNMSRVVEEALTHFFATGPQDEKTHFVVEHFPNMAEALASRPTENSEEKLHKKAARASNPQK